MDWSCVALDLMVLKIGQHFFHESDASGDLRAGHLPISLDVLDQASENVGICNFSPVSVAHLGHTLCNIALFSSHFNLFSITRVAVNRLCLRAGEKSNPRHLEPQKPQKSANSREA